LNSCLVYDF
jgi:hypothetical protein